MKTGRRGFLGLLAALPAVAKAVQVAEPKAEPAESLDEQVYNISPVETPFAGKGNRGRPVQSVRFYEWREDVLGCKP